MSDREKNMFARINEMENALIKFLNLNFISRFHFIISLLMNKYECKFFVNFFNEITCESLFHLIPKIYLHNQNLITQVLNSYLQYS